MFDDMILEMARTVRELEARVDAKLRARQLGEAWIGLEQGLGSPEGQVQAERHAERVAA